MEDIKELKSKLKKIEKDLQNPSIFNDKNKMADLSKEYHLLKNKIEQLEKINKINEKIDELEKLIKENKNDEDLVNLAQEEIKQLNKEKIKIKSSLTKENTFENRNVIMEIRAGTGGEEASLFAADLFRMYSRYAEKNKWLVKILNKNQTSLGGFKEIIFRIVGQDAYGKLKYESGVHRVQRIPETEKSGRIHTSTATVAVLPEVEEIDIKIKPQDLKIETFRSSGHGGQNVQKLETAVRITHLPTGIVVVCQDERSQQKNKEKALKILRSKIFLAEEKKKQEEIAKKRKLQIKHAERSEKIRTYNFPQNRVTDHRIGKSWYNLSEILDGKIDEIIEKLQKFYSLKNEN